MTGPRRTARRATVTVIVLLVQAAVCLAVALAPPDSSPHDAPVTISGPAIVATALADQVNSAPGHALAASAADDVEQAREAVERGRAVAAVSIDLQQDRATLFVSSAQGSELNDAVVAVVRAIARPYSATVTTEDVAPLPAGSSGQTGLRGVVAVSIVLGLVIAIVLTWRRGPVADTWTEAVRRIVVAGGLAGAAALGLAALAATQVGGGFAGWWAVAWLAIGATSTATLALEGVLGVAGIGLATTVFVVTAAPLARIEHLLLLPEPWSTVSTWLPHGAALEAARQVAWFGGAGATRPVAVLVYWLLVSLVVLAVARSERRRAGVIWGGQDAAGRGTGSRTVPEGSGAT